MRITRNRSLWTIGLAESVSGLGNWITMLAVFAIVVFRGQGSVAQSSGIFLAGMLPTLLCSPLAGWLCDRFDRKWLMVGSELLDAVTVAGLIFAQSLWLIYALLAVQAVVMSVMAPARQAVVPDLVGPDELTRANALLQQLSGIIKIAGPVLGGMVLVVISPHAAFILDVVSFILSAAILSRLPSLPPHRAPQAAAAPAVSARPDPAGDSSPAAGQPGVLATLRGSARLQVLFAAMFLAIFIIVGFDVLGAVVIRDVLGGDERMFGLIIGLVGLGTTGVSAALFFSRRPRAPWPDVLGGLLLLAVLPAAAAIAARLANPTVARNAFMFGCLVGGIGNGLLNVQIGTLLQQLSPPALLGRMGGIFQSTAVAGQLLGTVVTPLLVPVLLSIGNYFALAAVALALLVLMAALTMRRAPQPVPAPVEVRVES